MSRHVKFTETEAGEHQPMEWPHERIHGQTRRQQDERGYAIIEDPDGVAVGLMSPVSPDKRYPPPEV